MAITKLRLQQIQDEVADFAKSEIVESHVADPETLHGLLHNLQKTFEMRFGADAIHSDGIYKNADLGKVAHFGAAQDADLLIKHENESRNIEIQSAQHANVSADKDVVLAATENIQLDATLSLSASANTSAWLEAGTTMTLLAQGAMTIDANDSLVIDVEGAVDFDGDSLDADFVGAASIVAGAASELKVTGNLELSSSAEMDVNANSLDLDTSAGASIVAGTSMELSASGAMDVSAGVFTGTFNGGFSIAGSAASDIIVAEVLDIAGTSLELSASSTHIQFDDAYNTFTSGYYAGGVKLAEEGDWASYEAAVGEKSILKAIAEAAGGSANSGRYVADAAAQDIDGENTTAQQLIAGQSFSAVGTAAQTLGTLDGNYTANELAAKVEVYVNGMRLRGGAFVGDMSANPPAYDYCLTNGTAGSAFADAGTTFDIKLAFALEEDDVVEIVVL